MHLSIPYILSLSIWLPIAFGVLVLAVGREDNPGLSRSIALVGSLVSMFVTIPLITDFDNSQHGMQFIEKMNWIERFHISYSLGIDGISLWFIDRKSVV